MEDCCHVLLAQNNGPLNTDTQSVLLRAGYLVSAVITNWRDTVTLADQLKPDLLVFELAEPEKRAAVEAVDRCCERLGIPLLLLAPAEVLAKMEWLHDACKHAVVVASSTEADLRRSAAAALGEHERFFGEGAVKAE
ncbi:MAG: hypothetical protein ABFD44_08085 [Anaerolineaceae bacterium]